MIEITFNQLVEYYYSGTFEAIKDNICAQFFIEDACKYNHSGLLYKLLSSGVDPKLALIYSCKYQRNSMARQLISKYNIDISECMNKLHKEEDINSVMFLNGIIFG